MYENGVMLRVKYHNLFPKDGFFRLSNMRVLCSVPQRTTMSLQSFMAGFFPPPLLDTNLPIYWQPFFYDIDYAGRVLYFNDDFSTCPVYGAEIYKFMTNPPAEQMRWLEDDKAILEDLASRLGIAPIKDLVTALMVADGVKVLISIDPKTPQWAVDAYKNTLFKYGELLKTFPHSTPVMVKIRGGPMVTEMVKNMEAIARNDQSGKKVLIYSAHDMTVASLAFALGVEDQIPAPISFSDTIMVDLVDRKGSELAVEVVYMDNVNIIPRKILLSVPGCGTSCPLSVFRNAVKDVLVDDLDKLCGL